MPVRYRILGPLDIVGTDGESIPLRSKRQRAILAALIVNRGQPVSKDRLVDVAWGSRTSGELYNALLTQISRLRRLLPPDVLTSRWSGYSLAIEPDELDANVFSKLLEEAKRCRATEASRAELLLDEALALWRGRALDGLTEDPDIEAEALRLQELEMIAREERFATQLDQGNFGEAIPSLEAFVSAHPLREQAAAQLMTALYQVGRQAESLQVYARHRQMLAEELGIDPSHTMQELERSILNQNLPRADAPKERLIRLPAAGPSALPKWRSTFLGRDNEIDYVMELVRSHPLVTVTGAGGIGKTRLAAEAARQFDVDEFPDGIFMCSLAQVDSDAVPHAVAAAMGINFHQGSDIIASFAARIGGVHALLILDNCEHVLDAVCGLCLALLDHCPNLKILTTSREQLGVHGEYIVNLINLPIPSNDTASEVATSAAAAVFLDRARAVRDVAVDDTSASHIARICRRLDGIPLAIELAASQLRLMSVRDLADRLDSSLVLANQYATTDRHRTVRALIGWSHDLLTDDEKAVFRRMAVFSSSATLEAIENVCSDVDVTRENVSKIVMNLVTQSMLTVEERLNTTLYGMYTIAREYASALLDDPVEQMELRLRHAQYYGDLAEELKQRSYCTWGADLTFPLWLSFENMRTAVEWCLSNDAHPDLSFTVLHISWFLIHELHAHEITTLAEKALDKWHDAAHPLQAEVAGVAATGHIILGNAEQGHRRALEGLECENEPDSRPAIYARRALAQYHHFITGDDEAALAAIDKAISVARDVSNDLLAVEMNLIRADIVAALGDRDSALEITENASREALAQENACEIAWSRFMLGALHISESSTRARLLLNQAINDGERINYPSVVGVAWRATAALDVREGKFASAVRHYRMSLEHFIWSGDPQQQRLSVGAMLPLLVATGRLLVAASVLGAVERSTVQRGTSPLSTPLFRSARDELVERLDDEQLDGYLARGSLLTLEELVADARDALDELSADPDVRDDGAMVLSGE